MITIDDISFKIGDKPLFENASAQIPDGHKVGIVGRNGTGKTTLFGILTGKFIPDDGEIKLPKGIRIGEIEQEAPASDNNLIETVLEFDTERKSLLDAVESETDSTKLADMHARLGDIGAYSAEARAGNILHGLGFNAEAQMRTVKSFSGGWRMRIALAGVLFSQPDILLLDEPTNYLDLEGTLWLQSYLAKYPRTVIIISHDRSLLNKSVGSILHLQNRKLKLYSGNYDTFDAVRRAKLAEQASMAKKQDDRRAHLQKFVDRFRAQANKAKQAQSRIKMIEKMQPIAAATENAVKGFVFPKPEELKPPIFKSEEVFLGYGGPSILKKVSIRIDQSDRIALIRANGQGKSTLSKFLAYDLVPTEGSFNASSKLKIGYFAQHQVDTLNLEETPLDHIRAERPGVMESRLRSILSSSGIETDQVDLPVRQLSGGQKARLSLVLATLDAPHLLILDEPTNHLDMESREALIFALAEYQGAVVLVSHDPHLINAVADQLWLIKDGSVTPFQDDLGAYEKLLLQDKAPTEKKSAASKVTKTERRKQLAPFRSEVRKCEDRIEKITEMLSKIDILLADPEVYTGKDAKKFDGLNKKRAEIVDAMELAERLWLQADEKLNSMLGKLDK